MKSGYLATILAILMLSGCAGTSFGMDQQVRTGNMGIEEIDASAGLYRITVMNTVDFDWNGDLRSDREKAVAFFLGKRCASTKIVSDVPLPMGTHTFTSKERIKHSMTVKCLTSG